MSVLENSMMETKNKQKNIPEGWVETTLGEVVYFVNDKVLTSKISLKNYISTENLLPNKNGVIDSSALPTIQKVNHFKIGDTLFSNIRTYFKKVWLSDTEGGSSNDILIFRPLKKEKLINKFLFYYISSNDFIDFTVKTAKGTKMPRGDKDAIISSKFIYPKNIEEQKQIAKILTSFDDKIDLLQAQNKTLEDIGQTIFKEWFGKYQVGDFESAEEVLEFERGVEIGSKNYFKKKNILENSQRFYRVADIAYNGKQANIFTEKKNLKNNKFERKDILISFDGTVGRVFVGGAGGYSTGIRKIYSKEKFNYIKNAFIYFWGKSKNVQEIIKLYSEGTTIQHAGKSIKYLEIISDKESVLEAQKNLMPIFKKILLNLEQIQTLTKTRDALLPKLMSGKVRVKMLK